MTMTLKDALLFRLPNGKALGEASLQDWLEAAEFCEKELERVESLDSATMTAEDCQRLQVSLDRQHDLHKAMAEVLAELGLTAENVSSLARRYRQTKVGNS